jgi:hypothetical protein
MPYLNRSPYIPKSEKREFFVVLVVLIIIGGAAYFRASQPSGSDLFGRSHIVASPHGKILPG